MKNRLKLEKIMLGIKEKISSFLLENKKLLVACSGGRDSVFLVYLLHEVFTRFKFPLSKLSIVHVNYHLRDKDSDEDERFVRSLATSYSIECSVLSTFYDKHEGVQDWARRTRYDYFERLHLEQNAVVAVAHHMNDVAENILFRLTRGSSLSNLIGMDEMSSYIWRPLLGISRKSIDDFIEELSLEYREDRSNLSTKYTRNKIRLDILPRLESMYPGASERIVNTITDAVDIVEFARKKLEKDISSFKNDKIPVSYIKELPDGMCFLLFDILIDKMEASSLQLSRSNFSNFIAKIKSGQRRARTWSHSLAHGLSLYYDRGFIYIQKTDTV